MRNRLKDYGIGWWEELKMKMPFDPDDIPESPSEEAISAAYRAVAEWPDTHSQIAEANEAIQKIKKMPFSKEKELILTRYGLDIEEIHNLSKALFEKMERDFAQADQLREEKESDQDKEE